MCALESIHRQASVISSAFPLGNVKLKKKYKIANTVHKKYPNIWLGILQNFYNLL